MSVPNSSHELGSPPGAPLPEGVFPVKSGPPIAHPMTAEIRERGPEWAYRFCRERGFNEQSTYSFLRSFFRLTFKEFKALARRVNRTEPGATADGGRDSGSS
jgi:hypothetical protein